MPFSKDFPTTSNPSCGNNINHVNIERKEYVHEKTHPTQRREKVCFMIYPHKHPTPGKSSMQ
jgi:hypothetical protein